MICAGLKNLNEQPPAVSTSDRTGSERRRVSCDFEGIEYEQNKFFPKGK